ncbi:MAG: hypothetical protein IMF17_02235 [Proteobacteria bacterium]|nr:hypothetical protein [Pseudomonadota bacterium]
MKNPNLSRFILLFFSLFLTQEAKADWVNLTGAEISSNIAEIYILDDHVKVKLEIYPRDLAAFEDLLPQEWLNNTSNKQLLSEASLNDSSSNTLTIKTGKGTILPAQVKVLEARQRIDRYSPMAGKFNPITRRRIPDAPADKGVIYAEIIYPFDKKPEQLQISPPLDKDGSAQVTLGFVTFHQSVPVNDFRYLGLPATLNLNWQDPWYTKFENSNLTRHHKYPLMLYLYAEPRQVKLEALMRISDIAEMTGFDVVNKDEKSDRRKRLHDHINAYFLSENPLTIDAKQQKPDVVKISYFTIDLTGLKFVENPSEIDDASLLVGVSRQYYVDALPQHIESQWPYFNKTNARIPIIATDPAGPLPGFVVQDDPVFSWNNHLKQYQEPVMNPVEINTGWRITLPYFGQWKLLNQLPDEQQTQMIVSNVFENIRVAFIEKKPGQLSSALSKLVAPDQVDPLTRELSKLFAPAIKRGGTGSVKTFGELQIKEVRGLEDPDGFSTTLSGSAIIHAMHWGHTDQLKLDFELLLDLVEAGEQWQLSELTIVNLKESQ